MPESEKPTVAFILSLIGGITLLLGGGMISMMGSYSFGGMMKGYRGYGGMMRGYAHGYEPWYGMMGGYGFGLLAIAGALFGVVVIVGSLMLYSHPAHHSKWGIIIVIFSALSVLETAMGGLLGLILGVLGGIFALTWKPPTMPKS